MGEFHIALTAATRRSLIIGLNAHARATHLPGTDRHCPICGVPAPCRRLVAATRALRAAGVQITVLPPHPFGPTWHCELCDEPWPCIFSRCMLSDQYADQRDRPALVAYLKGLMEQAAGQLPQVPRHELHERFLAWVTR